LTLIPAVGLFLLVCANPFAQTTKLPAPSTHVSDFAGVIDNETKSRVESLLQRLQEKSKIALYIAIVENSGDQELSVFSKQLATDWRIGARTSRTNSLLLVISSSSKTAFTQVSNVVQRSLPDGVVGEMAVAEWSSHAIAHVADNTFGQTRLHRAADLRERRFRGD